MTFKNFICKGVLVFTGLLLIGWLGQYIYMVNGEIDWFRLMLVYGVPVGIPHMFIIVPWHWDLSGILGMVALCVIVGGVFGCVIAAGLAVRAIWYIVGYPISRMLVGYNGKRMKRNNMVENMTNGSTACGFILPFLDEGRCGRISIST